MISTAQELYWLRNFSPRFGVSQAVLIMRDPAYMINE